MPTIYVFHRLPFCNEGETESTACMVCSEEEQTVERVDPLLASQITTGDIGLCTQPLSQFHGRGLESTLGDHEANTKDHSLRLGRDLPGAGDFGRPQRRIALI